jgi:hypothetical protein
MQKLQNEIIIFQRKACKLGNNLINHVLTIIGKFFVEKWAKEEGQAFVPKRRS